MMRRVFLLALASIGVWGCSGTVRARADADAYVSQRQVIRVGMLVSSAVDMGGTLGPENPDPNFFYVLDSRTDLKPSGVELVNPLAPSVVTGGIYTRWKNRVRMGYNAASHQGDPAFVAGTPENQIFQVGARVTKNMGCYWEVNLDNLSSDDLAQYDLLYIHTHKANVSFTTDQIVKLRRFVDGGGTLWFDNCGGFTLAPGAPFLIDMQFANGGGATSGAVIGEPTHPLMTYPYALTPEEVQYLGDKFVGGYYVFNPRSNPGDPTQNDPAPGQDAANPPGRSFLVPVVWNSLGLPAVSAVLPNPKWRPYVLAGQMGAGRLVISAMDSGCAINDYVGGYNAGYGGNSAAISGEDLQGAHPRDLKFVYNLLFWASAHTTPLTDVRRSGATTERLASALEEKWSPPPPGAGLNVGGVALYRHCVYFVDSACVLHCYNATPGEDLDNDGNPDEGIPDYILGAPYDEIWRLDLKPLGVNVQGASAPTIVQFYDPTFDGAGAPGAFANPLDRELVVVVLSDGTVVAARALPRSSSPGLPLAPQTWVDWRITPAVSGAQPYVLAAANNPGGQTPPVPAAAWSEGVLFVAFNTNNGGKIAAIDPRRGTSAFHLQRPISSALGSAESMVPDNAVTLPEFWTTPTVGYVRDETTGAIDKMVYCQLAGSNQRPASLSAIQFATKSEPLAFTGTTGKFRCTRATGMWWVYGQNADDNENLRPRVYNLVGNTATELTYTSSNPPGNNQFTIIWENNEVRVVVGTLNPGVGQLLADYTLDWAPPQNVQANQRINVRSALVVPDRGNPSSYVMAGASSLAGTDLQYYNAFTPTGVANLDPGTSTLVAAKEQGAQTVVKWSYPVHNGFFIQSSGASDNYTNPPRFKQTDRALPLSGGRVYDMRFLGSPAVRNDIVYAVATGNLKMAPNDQGIPVSVLCAFRANPTIEIDLGHSIPSQGVGVRVRQPNVFAAQSNTTGATLLDVPAAQLSIDYPTGKIRINSFAKGQVPAECGGTSLPFLVQVGSDPELFVTDNPEYQEVGATVLKLPAGALDNLLWYAIVPATLALPNDFTLTSPTITNSNIGQATSGPSIQGTTIWVGWANGSVLSFDADPGANDPSVQGPGSQVPIYTGTFRDGTSVTGHLRWISPSTGGPVLLPPAGSANLLAVNSLGGMRTFEDTLTVIADAKRLVEVDAAGEAVWVCEGSRSYSVAGGDLPLYLTDPNSGNVVPVNPENRTGVQVVKTVPWSRPSVVRHVSLNDLLVVDTGNNRVVQIDRGGNIAWEITQVADTFKHVLRAGDPTSLNEPSDCAFWTEFYPNLTQWFQLMGLSYRYDLPAFVVHYLIADTGNYRVIEIVDVFDSAGRIVQPNDANNNPLPITLRRQVNFVSSTYGGQNQRYRYRSTVRMTVPDSILPASWQTGAAVRYLTLAAIDNARLTDPAVPARAQTAAGATTAGAGGSLVLLKEDGTALTVVNVLRIPLVAAPNVSNDADYWIQPVVAPTFVSYFIEVTNGVPMVKVLLCDANGVYQARPQFVSRPEGFTETLLDVEWFLSAQDYYLMTGKRLQAASVKRLNAGAGNVVTPSTPALHQFLISNRYLGEDDPEVFGANDAERQFLNQRTRTQGEVFVLNPATFSLLARPAGPGALGFGYQPDYVFNAVSGQLLPNPMASIVRRIPNEAPVNSPGFKGFTRAIGDPTRATSTSVLEQPTCADRPQ